MGRRVFHFLNVLNVYILTPNWANKSASRWHQQALSIDRLLGIVLSLLSHSAMWHYVIINSKLYQVAYLWKELADEILTHSCPLNLKLKCRSYRHLKNEKLSPPLFDSRKESFKILMTHMQNQHSSPHGKCLFVLLLSTFLIPWQIKGPPKTSLSP